MLTPKQEKFCIEYAKCGNARQAYISAGYKHKKDNVTDAAASRLLSNVKVKSRLAELAEEAKNNSIADIQEMQQILTSIIRQEKTEEILLVDPVSGLIREEKTASIKDMISAIEKLGKMQGAFVDKVEQQVDMELSVKIDYGEGDSE